MFVHRVTKRVFFVFYTTREYAKVSNWDGFRYGPLEIVWTEGREVRIGDTLCRLSSTQFAVLLRLMTCYGAPVAKRVLEYKLGSEHARVAASRLRTLFRRFVNDAVSIVTLHGYGLRLSLNGRVFFLIRHSKNIYITSV